MASIFDYIKSFFTGEPVKKKKKRKKKKKAPQQVKHTTQSTTRPLATQVYTQRTLTTEQATEVSEIQEYIVTQTNITQFEILLDSLGLVKRRFVAESGVITVPFDASGCDFETKRQLSGASSQEFGMNNTVAPNSFICTEVARRMFSAIKNMREECYIAGYSFISLNQDIDADGFMEVEVTNTQNGNSVFFDIPATVMNDGNTSVNFDLIDHNLLVATKKIA